MDAAPSTPAAITARPRWHGWVEAAMFVATGLPLPFALVVFAWADKQHGMRCNPNLGLAALILAVYAVVVPTAAMVGAVAWAFVFRNRKRVLFVIPLVLLAYFAAAVCMFIMMGCALGG